MQHHLKLMQVFLTKYGHIAMNVKKDSFAAPGIIEYGDHISAEG